MVLSGYPSCLSVAHNLMDNNPTTQPFEPNQLPFPVIFFDGVCNLCNQFVDFMIHLDKRQIYRYASLQSDLGQYVLQQNRLSTQNLKTILLLQNGKIYQKSDAVIRILVGLGGIYRLARFLRIMPQFIRDAVYTFVSSNRYLFFGKKETCRLPSADEKARFLD